MKRFIPILVVLSLAACARPDTTNTNNDSAESWQVKDTSSRVVTTPPEETTPATTPKEELPSPIEEDEFRSVYAPGAFPWAKPGYRVIFHHAAESERNKQRPDLLPLFEDTSFIIYETAEGGIYHQMRFDNAAQYLAKGARVFPEDIQVDGRYRTKWPEYRGVYLPKPLEGHGEPTLHLFEQGGYDESMVYEMDEKIVIVQASFSMIYYVPRNTLGAEWLKCQTKNGYRLSTEVSEDNPCGNFHADKRTPYDVVAFFKEDPFDKNRSYGHTVEAYGSRHRWHAPRLPGGARPVIEDDEDYGEPVPLHVDIKDYKFY